MSSIYTMENDQSSLMNSEGSLPRMALFLETFKIISGTIVGLENAELSRFSLGLLVLLELASLQTLLLMKHLQR